MSDHDAQIIVLPDSSSVSTNQVPTYTRTVDSNSTQKFIELLSYENWECVFLDADVNLIFNNFQSIYLRIFHCSFPIRKKSKTITSKPWITTGIKISCANKSRLFQIYRCSKDPGFKIFYKKYCKILSLIILAAKKYYDELIIKSINTTKATRNIVKTVTNTGKNSTK